MRKNNPLVSIVIPCYNHENYIEDSIQSILDQTYSRIELIIIDDGSKDQSVAKIQSMLPACEQRFERVFFNTRANKGLCATLNEAIALCQGEYVSFIASDDIMLAHKTQLQVDYLEQHSEVSGIFAGIDLIDANNQVVGKRVSNRTEYSFDEILLNKHDLPTLTQMFRLKDIVDAGGYDENIKIEDWYMLLKLTRQQKILRYLPIVVCQYRIHDDSFSQNGLKMAVEMKKVSDLFKDYKLYYKINHKINRYLAKALYETGDIKMSIIIRIKALFELLYYRFF